MVGVVAKLRANSVEPFVVGSDRQNPQYRCKPAHGGRSHSAAAAAGDVVYTMDKLVTGAKENRIFPDFLAGDRLLMMVHGEVVAGIDFSNLKFGDVKVDGKQIRLHLPASQVFRTRIDSAKTRVYSRQTGLLVPTDPNLETQVRQEAERQLQEAALADGILQTAQQNAASTISSLLQGLGFEHIDFD